MRAGRCRTARARLPRTRARARRRRRPPRRAVRGTAGRIPRRSVRPRCRLGPLQPPDGSRPRASCRRAPAPSRDRTPMACTRAAVARTLPLAPREPTRPERKSTVTDTVLYELDGHVATITYNRPDALNAVDGELREDLNAAFARFRDEEDAWVAIVTGAGRAFCVGGDVRGGRGNPVGEFPGTFWEKPTANSFESGWEIFKPVIAAVNGYCLGYGLTLVTWCDFVIASERAEFGFPEAAIGVPTIVGAIRLPHRINWQYAMELLLTGERIDAARAKEIGLAGWVVPHERLMDDARALADRLVNAAPLAARATKEVAVRTATMSSVEAIRFGETMRRVAGATEDAREGGRAATEGRRPEWKGR